MALARTERPSYDLVKMFPSDVTVKRSPPTKPHLAPTLPAICEPSNLDSTISRFCHRLTQRTHL
jgi:hypothetical protein